MKRLPKIMLPLVACAFAMIFALQYAVACQVTNVLQTKAGILAAASPETLIAATKLAAAGNQAKLAALIDSGAVRRLGGKIKVEVVERSFEFKTLKIKLPQDNTACWVMNGALDHLPPPDTK